MEKFENSVDIAWDWKKEIKSDFNMLEEKVIIENSAEIDAIKRSIESLKSFEDLPITINYPISSKEKINQKKFPQKLDMRPKPFGKKWKKIDWNIIDNPDPLMICLDNRKFTVTPEIWTISSISIRNWIINMDVSKFWIKINSQSYDAERMTKLLIILRTHKNWLNKDIEWTPWAIVKEV